MKTWSELEKIQPLACKVIKNSIQKERVSHAYLFQGARGTGKEPFARLLAKTLFCKNRVGVEPCQECNVCRRIDSGNHPDVHWVVPEGQSIKIEQIRNLQKEFAYSALESNQKVYIINSAETLTINAANRILKFLEEPNQQTTAIMLTENSQAILPTIRSRCQIIDFQPLNPTNLQQELVNSGMSHSSAVLLSALTNNIDEALQWNNDEWFAQARKIMVQLVEMLTKNHVNDAYLFIHQIWVSHFKERKQQEQGLDLMLLAFRDILYFQIGNKESIVFFAPADERLEQFASVLTQEKLIQILQHVLQAKRKLKQNVQPTLVMEQLVLRIEG